jgi:hypothetical protein
MARRSPDDVRVVLAMSRREKTNDVELDVNGARPYDNILPLELPSAFCKEVVLAVDMDHAVLESALPLVADP